MFFILAKLQNLFGLGEYYHLLKRNWALIIKLFSEDGRQRFWFLSLNTVPQKSTWKFVVGLLISFSAEVSFFAQEMERTPANSHLELMQRSVPPNRYDEMSQKSNTVFLWEFYYLKRLGKHGPKKKKKRKLLSL